MVGEGAVRHPHPRKNLARAAKAAVLALAVDGAHEIALCRREWTASCDALTSWCDELVAHRPWRGTLRCSVCGIRPSRPRHCRSVPAQKQDAWLDIGGCGGHPGPTPVAANRSAVQGTSVAVWNRLDHGTLPKLLRHPSGRPGSRRPALRSTSLVRDLHRPRGHGLLDVLPDSMCSPNSLHFPTKQNSVHRSLLFQQYEGASRCHAPTSVRTPEPPCTTKNKTRAPRLGLAL